MSAIGPVPEKVHDGTDFSPSPGECQSFPAAETKRSIGPVMPPGFTAGSNSEVPNVASVEPLPLQSRIIHGPALPPGFQRPTINLESPSVDANSVLKPGPSLDDDSDDEFVGPSPALMAGEGEFSAAAVFAERLERQARLKRESEQPVEMKRESWMTELPDVLLGRPAANLLPTGPRSFKRKTDDYVADFSGWTSGPNKKLETETEATNNSVEVLEYEQTLRRERELELEVAKHNKEKRSETLVALRQKDKAPDVSNERKPFDRETDLGIHKLRKMDADEISKRASALKERFSSSAKSGQKFL